MDKLEHRLHSGMRLIIWIFAIALLVSRVANAQTPMPVEQVCGPPGEEISTAAKGNLDLQAQTLAKIGSVQLQGAAEKVQREVMIRANRSDAARQLFYMKRISCIIIYQ